MKRFWHLRLLSSLILLLQAPAPTLAAPQKSGNLGARAYLAEDVGNYDGSFGPPSEPPYGSPYGPPSEPQPTPVPSCPVTKFDIVFDGLGGLPKVMFQSSATAPQCLSERFTEFAGLCKGRGNFTDDCILGRFLQWLPQSARYVPPIADWQKHLKERRRQSYLLTDSCQAVTPAEHQQPLQDCLASFHWRTSPISLLWNHEIDIEHDPRIVSFKLNPYAEQSHYVWKASKAAPLLVYDPEHKGEIVDGAQLFGEWTFGGKKYAALATDSPASGPSQWRDGFEALATLDTDGNGELRGAELAALGLWFDENRDGVSQPGEVKTLAEVGVTALFYRSDYVDPKTRNVVALKGFERNIGGKTEIGTAVDWYGESGASVQDILAKQLAADSFCGIAGAVSPAVVGEDSPSVSSQRETAPAASASTETHPLNGAWKWSAEEQSGLRTKQLPNGFLTFSVDGNTVRGHSFAETGFLKPVGNSKSIVTTTPLEGEMSTEAGAQVLRFHMTGPEGTAMKSTVSQVGPNSIRGTTEATVKINGTQQTFSYTWLGTRM